MKRPFFSILGGMGTLATESFIRLLNLHTHARSDQDYLDYVVFNDASVPDRTQFLLEPAQSCSPLPVLCDDVKKASLIGSSFIVLTCNTAHAFYDTLQENSTTPILHMPRLAVEFLAEKYPVAKFPRVGFLGTFGSLHSGVYEKAITDKGFIFVPPSPALQQKIHDIIYIDIKEKNAPCQQRYESVLEEMLDPHGEYRCDSLILGCTELSLLHELFPTAHLPLVDAQEILVKKTIEKTKELRKKQ